MPSLTEFVEWFNLSNDAMAEFSKHNVAFLTEDISSSFVKSFTQPRRSGMGASELGYPAVLLALKKLGINSEAATQARKMNMFWGNVFEAGLLALMRAQGFVVHTQTLLDFHGVAGHIDALINGTVVEVKTMSEGYFNQFCACPNDDRGYLSQLSVYAHCLNAPGVWLCYNKAAREHDKQNPLRIIELDPVIAKQRVERAVQTIEALESIESLEDVFSTFEPPAPRAEVYRGTETGAYLVPASMKYTDMKYVFYEIVQGINKYKTPTEYIVGINDYHTALEALHDLGYTF